MTETNRKWRAFGPAGQQGRTAVMLALLGIALAGCNTPTAAVEDANPQTAAATQSAADAGTSEPAAGTGETATATPEAQPNIVRRAPTVTQKGTNIRAIVNGQPVTNYDIQRRAAFLQLRRVGGNRNERAMEEMVEQSIKLQEARRRNVLASDSEVDRAFANFAQGNRLSTSQLGQVLSQAGVTADHFKEFIRTQISWQRAVGAKFRAETRQQTTQDTLFQIRQSGGEKPQTTEYLLEQVIFVVPSNRATDKGYAAQRRKDAEAFRAQFSRCGASITQAAAFRDVTVRTLPRSLEPQLPPEWEEELKAMAEGTISQPKSTDRGVELIAICSKRIVDDDNAAVITAQAQQFEQLNEQGDKVADDYLAELKSQAQIVYR